MSHAVLHRGLEQDYTGPLGSTGGVLIPTGFQQPYADLPLARDQTQAMEAEIQSLLEKQAIVHLTPPILQGITAVCLWYRRRTEPGGP